jgi:hypothetical protein
MRRLLIFLSGAEPEILAVTPADRPKFEALGASILIAGGLATASMWFVLTSVLNVAAFAALPAALLWGLIITGMDRWLVGSVPAERRRRWAIAVPRILIALIYGLIVSTPLVLRIFQAEINSQLARMGVHHASGLLLRLHAFDELASRSPAINAARWSLTLLFVLIECLPIAWALLQRGGNYELARLELARRELAAASRAIRGMPWSEETRTPPLTHTLPGGLADADDMSVDFERLFRRLGPPPDGVAAPGSSRSPRDDGGVRT